MWIDSILLGVALVLFFLWWMEARVHDNRWVHGLVVSHTIVPSWCSSLRTLAGRCDR